MIGTENQDAEPWVSEKRYLTPFSPFWRESSRNTGRAGRRPGGTAPIVDVDRRWDRRPPPRIPNPESRFPCPVSPIPSPAPDTWHLAPLWFGSGLGDHLKTGHT